jgi:succinate dehydrogenase / fumarate reductase flavoprotein subunit
MRLRSGKPTSAVSRLANPCFTQIPLTFIPVTGHYQLELTLMSESLRADGRIWARRN